MPDVALFPVPLPLSEEALSELGVTYASTEVTLGVDSSRSMITVADNSTSRCIQNTLKLLLTEKGSVPTNPGYGTNLLALGKYGYNPETLNADIVVILLDAESQQKRLDTAAGLPRGSQLGSIELLDLILLDAGALRVSIGIQTIGGVRGSFDLQV
jgi:hypothetical protein